MMAKSAPFFLALKLTVVRLNKIWAAQTVHSFI